MESKYFDRIVGKKENIHPRQVDEIVEREAKKVFDGELEKTKKDIEIIKLAFDAVRKYMAEFGREKAPPLPLDHVHLLPEGGTEEHSAGKVKGGSTSSKFLYVTADRSPSDVRFALRMFHEFFHRQSYGAIEIAESEEGKVMSPHRNGFLVYERGSSPASSFGTLEEAVIDHFTRRFYYEYVQNDERFAEELQSIDVSVEKTLFSRSNEYSKMMGLVANLDERNPDVSREEILYMLCDAHINGNLLPIGKLVEKTFGEKSFRRLGKA